jgi:peroxiredoxin
MEEKMNHNHRFLLPFLFFAFFFFLGCERDKTASQSDQNSAETTTPVKQIQMPEFELQSWQGNMVQSSSLNEKVLLVMFFPPICFDCINFLSEMEKLQNSFTEKEFSFVAIATGEFKTDVLGKSLEKRHISFPVLLDPSGSLHKKFKRNTLTPITYLVTKERTVVKQYLNHPDLKSLKRDVKKLL